MTEPTVVKLSGVSKRFVIHKEKSLKERLVNFSRSRVHREDFWALQDIDLEIYAGSTVGLIGPNGSGKSTLLKLIGGILQPSSGSVQHRGRLAALLELGAGFHPDLTGRENVYLNASILGLTRKQTAKYFDEIVDFSGIEPFIDTQVKFYSSGMYVRLAFAVSVHVDPDVLLVDEVLAVGDEPFQRKCMDRIRQFQSEGRTIVLVTHGLEQVAAVCDRAIVLEHGEIQIDGLPIDALRHLRADFETMRQDDIERRELSAERVDEPPSSARITRVTVSDGSGRPVSVVESGAEVVVTAEVAATADLPDPVVGISLDNQLGQPIFGTTSRLLGARLATMAGTSRFSFRLSALWLAEGQYTLTATLSRDGGVEVHRVPDAGSLTVQAPLRGFGYLNLPSEVEVQRVEA